MAAAIGIDIGGTFIDIVVADAGAIHLVKVPSTPEVPENGVLNGLRALIESGTIVPRRVRRIAHGSTVATNALLEGTWAKTALVTTRGFRDVVEIGRQNRPSLYDLSVERPPAIVPRDLRFEVTERIDASGCVLTPLDLNEVRGLVPLLRERGVRAVAVVLLFSYLNPAHERAVGRLLSDALDCPVTLSCDVLPEFREYERTSTTVVCAALRPVVGDYLGRLERGAARVGLPRRWQIMQSSGAVTSAGNAQEEPARILLSGPAGGVEGARAVGRLCGETNLITMDMGGTSCDVALVLDGRVGRTSAGDVGGYPVALRMTEIHTIGAGGGSIAWIDRGGALRVGPQSAGAQPGPACYGRGGERATITDAHLVLGHLLPDAPLGGLERLDEEAAREAVAEIADRLGIGIEEAALGMLEVADAAMERAIRVISVERGHDPREFSLLAFGGAGPLHAVSIARRLSIPCVIVPAAAGVLSAFGLLAAEIGREGSRSLVRPISRVDLAEANEIIGELRASAGAALRAEGIDPGLIRHAVSVDLRYVGQSHEINLGILGEQLDGVALSGVLDAFHRTHEARFGHAAPEEDIELVTVRVRSIAPPEPLDLERIDRGTCRAPRSAASWFDRKGPVPTQVIDRRRLTDGETFDGPAILLGDDATLVVPPGARARADCHGTLMLEVS